MQRKYSRHAQGSHSLHDGSAERTWNFLRRATVCLCGGSDLQYRSSIDKPLRLKAKVRYRQTEQWATVIQTDKNTLRIEFDEPQRAVTGGQAAVLYDGDTVVGGGTIAKAE